MEKDGLEDTYSDLAFGGVGWGNSVHIAGLSSSSSSPAFLARQVGTTEGGFDGKLLF